MIKIKITKGTQESEPPFKPGSAWQDAPEGASEANARVRERGKEIKTLDPPRDVSLNHGE
jgi:hypothetical protein